MWLREVFVANLNPTSCRRTDARPPGPALGRRFASTRLRTNVALLLVVTLPAAPPSDRRAWRERRGTSLRPPPPRGRGPPRPAAPRGLSGGIPIARVPA